MVFIARPTKSKVDRASFVILWVAIGLFIAAGICFALAFMFVLLSETGVPPTYTLGELGTAIGVLGMIVFPFFVLLQLWDIHRKHRKLQESPDDNDIDSEYGTAGGS